MSLTSHLKDKNSPIREFLRTEFPDTRTLLKDARNQVRNADTVRPDGEIPWGTIATALDYRVRYYFDVTPCSELLAHQGARRLTDGQNIDTVNIQLDYQHVGNEIRFFDRTTGKRVWTSLLDMNGGYGAPGIDIDHDLMNAILSIEHNVKNGIGSGTTNYGQLAPFYQEFFNRLEATTNRCSPVARRLDEIEEDELNRHCVVLALLEEVVRSGLRPTSPLAVTEFGDSEALIAIAQPHWLADLRALSWKFYGIQ